MLEGLGPTGQTVVFRVPSSRTSWGNLVWADHGQSREGKSHGVPAVPLVPRPSGCCPSSPPLSQALSLASVPGGPGEGRVGPESLVPAETVSSRPTAHPGLVRAGREPGGWQVSQGQPGRCPHSSQAGCVGVWPSQVFWALPRPPPASSALRPWPCMDPAWQPPRMGRGNCLPCISLLGGVQAGLGEACWSPSPHHGLGSWGAHCLPLLTPPLASALGELEAEAHTGVWFGPWLSHGSASTGGKSKGCSDSWGGGEGPFKARRQWVGGHFLFVAPQSLEEAFVLTSLETWVPGGAWGRGSEWGPVPMGAASGACQQLATFPVSSTAWLGSLHDRGLRGIHVGVGQGHSL